MVEARVTIEEPTISNEIEEIPIRVFAAKGDPGENGQDGQDGADGVSPTVQTSKTGKTTTITITDVNGVHTATILDGADGSGTGDMSKATYDTNNSGVVDDAEKVNNHTVEDDVPSGFFSGAATASGEGTSIQLSDTIAFKSLELKGDTDQDGTPTPSNPVNIDVVTGEQTVSIRGKNLINNNNLNYDYTNGNVAQTTLTTLPTGIRYNYGGAGNPVVAFKVIDLTGFEGKTIRLSSTFTGQGIRMQTMNESVTQRQTVAETTTSGETISWVVPSDLDDYHFVGFQLRGIAQSTVEFTNLIMTIDDADMTYKPCQSQSYIVNLGSTELCKIGDYQDYIYKSGDDWFIHKTTNKLVLDGTETTWFGWSYSSAFLTVFDAINPSTRTSGIVMSDRFIEGESTTQGSQWDDFPNGTVAIRQYGTAPKIGFKTDVANDLATWKTWLTTHNTTVYYALVTPTDTKITDNTLIGQLEALLNAGIYGRTTMISTGSLPAILTAEAFVMSREGMIKAATYTAGTGISISNGVITNTSPGTTYTAGTGISITNGVISCTFADGDTEEY